MLPDMYAKGRANPWGHKAALGLVLVLALVVPASARQSSPAVTDWSRIECKDERTREQKIKDGCIVEYQGGVWMECAVAHGCRVLPPLVTHSFIKPDLDAPRPQASAEAPRFTATITELPVWDFADDDAFNRWYWIPFGGAVVASGFDLGTTSSAIARGGREANPIFGGDDGRRVYYAANALATAGFLGYTAWLEHKGHPRIARTLLYLLTGLRTAASIWNYTRRR